MNPKDYNARQLAAGAVTAEHLTELATIAQRELGLTVDGACGPLTLAALAARFTPAESDPTDDPARNDAPEDDAEIGPDGWLSGARVERWPTTRGSYRWRTPGGGPAGLLWHWTATSHGTARTMLRARATGHGSTVHFWIEADGTIYQQVPTTRGAGHAGGPDSLRVKYDALRGVVASPSSPYSVNSYLIGCEIVNVGQVRRVGDEWLGWPHKYGTSHGRPPVVPDDQVEQGPGGKHYQKFTDAQLDAAERLAGAVADRYRLPRRALEWGHVDVDPKNKIDPGPIWKARHLPAILDRVY